ncbi:MAG TPA: hypothetical protein IAB14_04610 [Candidatus Stercoripulliclostridium merdipullorum]|uniref:Uncharacterized protein n=1 Tax=Candidatus Stercoripulliclostridium merdipullorum TaxID=2840952 RepID=A0A9D1NC33_9FIRM|nr:hypothetical protein [Candidatus Stercoripulliclostridium merdipullorum]
MQPSFLSRGPIEIMRSYRNYKVFCLAFRVAQRLHIIEVGGEDKFNEGDMPKAEYDNVHVILRACKSGEPEITGNRITVEGKTYTFK